jgi:hypothetical protein
LLLGIEELHISRNSLAWVDATTLTTHHQTRFDYHGVQQFNHCISIETLLLRPVWRSLHGLPAVPRG